MNARYAVLALLVVGPALAPRIMAAQAPIVVPIQLSEITLVAADTQSEVSGRSVLLSNGTTLTFLHEPNVRGDPLLSVQIPGTPLLDTPLGAETLRYLPSSYTRGMMADLQPFALRAAPSPALDPWVGYSIYALGIETTGLALYVAPDGSLYYGPPDDRYGGPLVWVSGKQLDYDFEHDITPIDVLREPFEVRALCAQGYMPGSTGCAQ
jgi:hypothetical protein